MSAMSASPVKPPVLPPSGVNVTAPVITSPPKVGTLTIAPTKSPNINHTVMPISLIADHKIAPQFPTQSQTGSSLPSQPLQRTLEKPKELPAPALSPIKPTSNGMENLPTSAPTLPETQVSAAPQNLPNVDPVVVPNELPEPKSTLPENAVELLAASTTESLDTEPESKEEDLTVLQPVLPLNEPVKVLSTSLGVVPQQDTGEGSIPPGLTLTTDQPPSVIPSASRTESSVPPSKPELKVATIPRQAAKRKREPKASPSSPEAKKEGKDDDRKSKRVRLPTQPYQSPLPELNIIAKISKSKSAPSKAADDKLIVFYRNEFLAVRNAEGGFYVCQAMQNIYKSSPRIRIRWLSQEGGNDTYSPDFYDHTDFDCILTNLNLDKVDKEKFRLPLEEQQRTESILKRALDVEKGVSEKPPVTEEHPDGLDLSLFRDESQLKKSKRRRNKSDSDKSENDEDFSEDEKNDNQSGDELDDDNDDDDDEEEDEKSVKKGTSVTKTSRKKKKSAKKKPPVDKKSASKTSSGSSKSSVQSAKMMKTESRVGSRRKSSVSSNNTVVDYKPVEKRLRTSTQSLDRTNKTRSVEETGAAKSQRERRAKSRK